MFKFISKRTAWLTSLFVVFVIAINPELRALFLIVDALGMEVVALLVATQLRSVYPFLSLFAEQARVSACRLFAFLGRFTLFAVGLIMPGGPYSASIRAALPIIAKNVKCTGFVLSQNEIT